MMLSFLHAMRLLFFRSCYWLSVFAFLCAVLGVIAGCSGAKEITQTKPTESVPTKPSVLPKGNFGLLVNSPSDDYAPFISPDTTSLYFTSKRGPRNSDTLETVYRWYINSKLQADKDGRLYFTRRLFNDGAVSFLTAELGFFATGHAPEPTKEVRMTVSSNELSREGKVVGGSDVYFFLTDTLMSASGKRDSVKIRAENLGEAINSSAWDSRPTVGTNFAGDSVLLVFSSERKTRYKYGKHTAGYTAGYCMPYRNGEHVFSSGERYYGNADLYYVFGRYDKASRKWSWSAVKNFAETDLLRSTKESNINTISQEYTPYLFCSEITPQLLFASDRHGEFDIYAVGLSIDWTRQIVTVDSAGVRALSGEVNRVKSDEWFPFIPKPHIGKVPPFDVYFASNRDTAIADPAAPIKNVGGFDIYKLPWQEKLNLACIPTIPVPAIVTVTLVDETNPASPVPSPEISITTGRAETTGAASTGRLLFASQAGSGDTAYTISTRQTSFVIANVNDGLRGYTAKGGSLYNTVECLPNRDSLMYRYVSRKYIRQDTVVKNIAYREVVSPYDSTYTLTVTPQDMQVLLQRVLTQTDTAGIGKKFSLPKIIETLPNGSYMVQMTEKRTKILRDSTVTLRTVSRGGNDSVLIENLTERAASLKTRMAGYFLFENLIRNGRVPDTLRIFDTIFVRPTFVVKPECTYATINDTLRFDKRVPYYQTAFWEVNTKENINRHLSVLSAKNNGASYVELHPQNSIYGGAKKGTTEPVNTKLYARQRTKYADYAATVSRDLDEMASRLTKDLIPRFLGWRARTKDTTQRLIVEIIALSDFRPIHPSVRYAPLDKQHEHVRYVAGRYDSASRQISLEHVQVQSGAWLGGYQAGDMSRADNNDTLSKLRAYFGYQEILKRMRKDKSFRQLEKENMILFADQESDVEEYRKKFGSRAIILLMKGEQIDRTNPSSREQQEYDRSMYFQYAGVRRLDVKVHQVTFAGTIFIESDCCRKPPAKQMAVGK